MKNFLAASLILLAATAAVAQDDGPPPQRGMLIGADANGIGLGNSPVHIWDSAQLAR